MVDSLPTAGHSTIKPRGRREALHRLAASPGLPRACVHGRLVAAAAADGEQNCLLRRQTRILSAIEIRIPLTYIQIGRRADNARNESTNPVRARLHGLHLALSTLPREDLIIPGRRYVGRAYGNHFNAVRRATFHRDRVGGAVGPCRTVYLLAASAPLGGDRRR